MKKNIFIILACGLILAACQEKGISPEQNVEGPEVVGSDPVDGARDLLGDRLVLTVTYDQNIRCTASNRELITIDNGAEIEKVFPDMAVLKIEVAGLEGGKTYTLTIPDGVVEGYKSNQNAASGTSVSFSMKYIEPYVPSQLDPVKTLTNPNASQQAKNVYEFLLEQSGKKTLSGVQSGHSHKNDFIDAVYAHTGRHPALAGYDFLYLHFSPTPDNWSWVQNYNDISAPKEQWENNGLVNYMWHWNVPDSKADWDNGLNNYNFDGYAFYTKETSFDIREALKPGTWQNDFIMKDIEEVAGYLQLLEDENIPVIWRPLHEAAGNYGVYSSGAWFWWGKYGPEPCKQLWRLLYNQLVNVYGLDNLIWVWTVDVAAGYEERNLEWYPGDEYVDVVGVDVYADDTEAKSLRYQTLVDLTKGRKLVTISECGNIPDPAKCMEAGNMWSWFMVWSSKDSDGNIVLTPDSWNLNTPDYWKRVMSSPYVMTREAMPSLK